MQLDDPQAGDILRRARVARIATLSRNGRPSVNPLYFAAYGGKLHLGTADWTLAARNVRADPRVSVLLNVESNKGDARVLRVSGTALVRTDAAANRAYNRHIAYKYVLAPAAVWNTLTHLRAYLLRRFYRAQSQQKGAACVIEVIPEVVEMI
jgi:hypothetical protein